MATIYFSINSGTPPFTASIDPPVAPPIACPALGNYSFTDIPDGNYTIYVTDGVCNGNDSIEVVCTTTTTTIEPTTTTTSTTGEPPTTTTTTTITSIVCCHAIITVSVSDILESEGNIIFENNAVYVYYTNCNGDPAVMIYVIALIYSLEVDIEGNVDRVVYYENDVELTGSSFYSLSADCIIPSDTTTTTTTTIP